MLLFTMASSNPFPPGRVGLDLKLPMPPPQLHTRSGNELERPSTPKTGGFTSPSQTPQGSPSKNQFPPGARDLPNVFEHALRLDPDTPTKSGRLQLGVGSPNKPSRLPEDEHAESSSAPGSALKKTGQENTPPTPRPGKESPYTSTPTHAALSRQAQYDSSIRARSNPAEALSSEDLEKLNLPKVRRLANVTQICQYSELQFLFYTKEL